MGTDLAIRLRKPQPKSLVLTMEKSVYLANRVRMEILKVMAKSCVGNREVIYVSAFSFRPLLHVRAIE